MEIRQWLDAAVSRLVDSESPRRDAEILLGHVIGKPRTWLLAFGETELTLDQGERLTALLQRRARGEPIAYVVGEREFWSLNLRVSAATLIPRPDTECLVEQALTLLSAAPAEVLDLGTGSGAIALALASERPQWQITGVDVQADAVVLARENALRLAIDNVHFMQGSWFKSLQGKRYALIVSNPPYIDAHDPHLTQGDVRFEPLSALVAPAGGLADLATIIAQAPDYLLPGGWLAVEHGWRQGEPVRVLLSRSGFECIATYKDYGDNERVSIGRRPV
ncbi:peptide chain release factor N(5)-glutamine methyltransferase [Acerihabitans sp. TG2]|uniref:peptide chain release factor N(5)-glutamine methyltransferase n=1 Tax=Acerihabitans sp. TG2 TaxID=3096008 RepID=UPI002B2258E5|nr:peptide chain release factor N(5)-glutamine methyltransferase [Acerihabitans sp. TG2]MEA9391049.1 peptide chain release factor N(5)-glutamine methyltransferase [Acerihabitans sp. TG2]